MPRKWSRSRIVRCPTRPRSCEKWAGGRSAHGTAAGAAAALALYLDGKYGKAQSTHMMITHECSIIVWATRRQSDAAWATRATRYGIYAPLRSSLTYVQTRTRYLTRSFIHNRPWRVVERIEMMRLERRIASAVGQSRVRHRDPGAAAGWSWRVPTARLVLYVVG